MEQNTSVSRRASARLGVASLAAFALLIVASGSADAVAVHVPLGDAYSFAVLGATEVTNSGATVINGDIGVSPGTAVGGGYTVNGTNHGNDAVAAAAQVSLDAAMTNAWGQTPTDGTISADLGGQTLAPGIYDQAGTMLLNGGTLTLNAGGDPNAIWIFRVEGDLSVNVGSTVSLIGGAQACNVYWLSRAGTAIGGGSSFVGTIMSGTSVTFGTNANLVGRALAATGNVTLLDNTITQVGCAVPAVPAVGAVAAAGGVGAGDGSTSVGGGNSYTTLMAATVLLGGLGVGAAVLIRRRRIENA
jgi:hypothetical protein